MNTRYQSTDPIRTMVAIVFAMVFSTTCIMSAVGPAAMPSLPNGSPAASAPVA